MQGCDFRWIYIKSCKEYSTVQNTDAALPASPVVYTLLYTHDLCATITFIMIFNMSLLHPCGQVIYSSYWFGLTPLYCTHFSSHLFSRIPERYIYLSEMWLVRDQERERQRAKAMATHTNTYIHTQINSHLPRADNNGGKAAGDETTYWLPARSFSFHQPQTTWTKIRIKTSAITQSHTLTRSHSHTHTHTHTI